MTDKQYEKAIIDLEDDLENDRITYSEYRRYMRELDEEYEESRR